MTKKEMIYVQASRHRHSIHLYTDRHSAGPMLTGLARREEQKQAPEQDYSPLLRQVETSAAKRMAHDLSPTASEKLKEALADPVVTDLTREMEQRQQR